MRRVVLVAGVALVGLGAGAACSDDPAPDWLKRADSVCVEERAAWASALDAGDDAKKAAAADALDACLDRDRETP